MNQNIQCSGCGSSLAPGSAFCGHCGIPQAVVSQNQPPPPQGQPYYAPPSNKGRKIALFAGGGVILLFIIIVGAIFISSRLSNDSTPSDDDNNSAEEDDKENTEDNQDNILNEADGLHEQELEKLGFECRIVTALEDVEENPDPFGLGEEYKKLLKDNNLTDLEILRCRHDEKALSVDVEKTADGDLLLPLLKDSLCIVIARGVFTDEETEEILNGLNDKADANRPIDIGIYTYSDGGFDDIKNIKQFKKLLDDEQIEYEPSDLGEFACDN